LLFMLFRFYNNHRINILIHMVKHKSRRTTSLHRSNLHSYPQQNPKFQIKHIFNFHFKTRQSKQRQRTSIRRRSS
jgi:hypothetical protein